MPATMTPERTAITRGLALLEVERGAYRFGGGGGNPNHVPAGNGRQSGEFTSANGAGAGSGSGASERASGKGTRSRSGSGGGGRSRSRAPKASQSDKALPRDNAQLLILRSANQRAMIENGALERVLANAGKHPTMADYRRAAIDENNVMADSRAARTSAWKQLVSGYSMDPRVPEFRAFTDAMAHAQDYQERRQIALLYRMRTDRTFREVMEEGVAKKLLTPNQSLTRHDVELAIARVQDLHRGTVDWTPTQRQRMASSVLGSLREYGLVKGVRNPKTVPMNQFGLQEAVRFAVRMHTMGGGAMRHVTASPYLRMFGEQPGHGVERMLMYAQSMHGDPREFRYQAAGDVTDIRQHDIPATATSLGDPSLAMRVVSARENQDQSAHRTTTATARGLILLEVERGTYRLFNPNHVPAGNANGGEFASGSGGGEGASSGGSSKGGSGRTARGSGSGGGSAGTRSRSSGSQSRASTRTSSAAATKAEPRPKMEPREKGGSAAKAESAPEIAGAGAHGAAVEHIPINSIHVGLNPREHFDAEKLQELAASIKANGLLQPISVRPHEGGYQVIAGERRLRAMQALGATHVPAIVHHVDDATAHELALIENINRADMRPSETARAYKALMDKGLSIHDVAERTGKSVASIQQHLDLLTLSPHLQKAVDEGRLHQSVVRDLAKLSPHNQEAAAEEILSKDMGAKGAKQLIKAYQGKEAQISMFAPEVHEPSTAQRSAKERYDASVAKVTEALHGLDDKTMEHVATIVDSPFRESERLGLMIKQLQRMKKVLDQVGYHRQVAASEGNAQLPRTPAVRRLRLAVAEALDAGRALEATQRGIALLDAETSRRSIKLFNPYHDEHGRFTGPGGTGGGGFAGVHAPHGIGAAYGIHERGGGGGAGGSGGSSGRSSSGRSRSKANGEEVQARTLRDAAAQHETLGRYHSAMAGHAGPTAQTHAELAHQHYLARDHLKAIERAGQGAENEGQRAFLRSHVDRAENAIRTSVRRLPAEERAPSDLKATGHLAKAMEHDRLARELSASTTTAVQRGTMERGSPEYNAAVHDIREHFTKAKAARLAAGRALTASGASAEEAQRRMEAARGDGSRAGENVARETRGTGARASARREELRRDIGANPRGETMGQGGRRAPEETTAPKAEKAASAAELTRRADAYETGLKAWSAQQREAYPGKTWDQIREANPDLHAEYQHRVGKLIGMRSAAKTVREAEATTGTGTHAGKSTVRELRGEGGPHARVFEVRTADGNVQHVVVDPRQHANVAAMKAYAQARAGIPAEHAADAQEQHDNALVSKAFVAGSEQRPGPGWARLQDGTWAHIGEKGAPDRETALAMEREYHRAVTAASAHDAARDALRSQIEDTHTHVVKTKFGPSREEYKGYSTTRETRRAKLQAQLDKVDEQRAPAVDRWNRAAHYLQTYKLVHHGDAYYTGQLSERARRGLILLSSERYARSTVRTRYSA